MGGGLEWMIDCDLALEAEATLAGLRHPETAAIAARFGQNRDSPGPGLGTGPWRGRFRATRSRYLFFVGSRIEYGFY